MQKYDGEQKTCLKILEEFIYNLNDAKGDVKKGVKNGYFAKTYTRPEERETLIRYGTVFFVNPQEFGAKLPWFWDC